MRVGNAAYNQQQHDVWGAVLDSVYLHARSREQLPESLWPVLKRQVEEAAEHWEQPDRGIWEVRGDPQHFVSSKLMCWVALDRGSQLARMHDDLEYAEKWQALADQIHADICTHGVDERGVFVQRYGSTALDASLLLMPLMRFLPPDDPRIRATVLAIADELTEDGLVLRYRVDETDDGLRGEEGTFTICSFWLVSALAEIGEFDSARKLCERLLAYASPLELYAEEIDPRSGRHLGNFPQAFTHLALINAVMHVIRAEELDDARGPDRDLSLTPAGCARRRPRDRRRTARARRCRPGARPVPRRRAAGCGSGPSRCPGCRPRRRSRRSRRPRPAASRPTTGAPDASTPSRLSTTAWWPCRCIGCESPLSLRMVMTTTSPSSTTYIGTSGNWWPLIVHQKPGRPSRKPIRRPMS